MLTYVAEVTTPRVRGLLAASGSFCAILGVFVQFIMGTFLQWRLIALISLAVPITSFCLLFFVPESPHWLIQKNRLPEAMQSLAWLRGWVSVEAVRAEYEVIYANVTKNFGDRDTSCTGKMRGYKQRSFLWPYTIIVICFFIGHFSGMTTLQTYAVQIFHTLKAPIDKYYATMLLGLAELLGTFLCILLVHYTGKRPLVLASTIGCGLCFLGTATYAYYLNEIPGSSISNVVSNSSDIFSKPLHSIVSFNETSEEGDTDDFLGVGITTTENPFEHSFFRNDSYEFMAAESMMDFSLANEQETADSDDYYVTTTTMDTSNDNSNNNGTGADENPVQANLPESFLLPVTKHAENRFLWIPLTLLLGSATLSHCGIRLIPWMLIGEIYPTAIRGGASGLSGGTGYIFGFLSNKLFLKLLATLTLPGTFWMYSGVSLCGALVLYFILPETEGRSLVDIEEHFTGGRTLTESRASSATPRPSSSPSDEQMNKNMLRNRNWAQSQQSGSSIGGDYGDEATHHHKGDGDVVVVDGLKGNFRRSSCEVSNAANRKICSASSSSSPTPAVVVIDSGAAGGGGGAGGDQQGVVIVVPDKRRSPDSIGNTLPPITNPLEVQNVNPRIYVEFCANNQTIDYDDDVVVAAAATAEKEQAATTKFNGSEERLERTNSEQAKRFEEAVAQHEGAEWLRRIKDAHHTTQMNDRADHVLGMKRKRIL